ncbi:MAG: FAD:protein FMN transferase [Acidimicrobiia bacterium]
MTNRDWVETRFPALGTTAVVFVTDGAAQAEAVSIVQTVIADVDLACSRFRPDSDIEKVNNAAGRPVAVGPTLIVALDVAIAAAQWTGGAVDPTIGESLRVIGYRSDFATMDKSQPALTRIEAVRGWSTVSVDHATQCVRVPFGVRLDVGATAKAWCADVAADRVFAATGTGVMVGLGGDFSIAGVAPEGGWPIFVTDWHGDDPDALGQSIAIDRGGIATSSVSVRRWTSGDREMHHIIDPGTGLPAESGWRTVSVVANSCSDANVATTAAIVKGSTAAEWLTSTGLPSRLVGLDGSVMHLNGWPEADPHTEQRFENAR